jgi:uncharacterized protein (DUF1330 family)
MAKGYILANVEVRDADAYEAYRSQTAAIVANHGGRFLVRGGAVRMLEGDLKLGRVVVLEFPSVEAAQAFYDSPEYQAVLPHRTRNARSDLAIIEGWVEAD